MILRRIPVILLLSYAVSSLILGTWGWQAGYEQQMEDAQVQAEQLSSHLTSQLEKYAYIPQLMSKDNELVDALLSPDNSAQLDITNRYLEEVNTVVGAADTYLLNNIGTTIAASNWQNKKTFVGRNFAFRPYYQAAISGSRGEYFALGSTSGRRGYFYSYPVKYAGSPIGVLVVKKDLSTIEEDWNSQNSFFVVTDSDDVVFMSNRVNWWYNSLYDLDEIKKKEIKESRRYLERDISSLAFSGNFNTRQTELTLTSDSSFFNQYLSVVKPLNNSSLTVRVLSPKSNLFWKIVGLIALNTLVFALLYLASIIIRQQKSKQRQIERIQAESKQKLEYQVMERTAELEAEIKVRADTESVLRQTQEELIQAAKLAVLGQMSTSISHELNNPLAAIRSYADNALQFLEKERHDKVDQNLHRISALTERMAKISQQLKAFAKKSDASDRVVTQISPVIIAAKELLKPQLKESQTQLKCEGLEQPLESRINPIQLEQVLVNLLTNAIQAMDMQPQKNILLRLYATPEHIVIDIEDTGPGIATDTLNHLFEPFFTTKQNGLGLGLPISQQIMQSMDGELQAHNMEQSGARFRLLLPKI
ncbi:putative Signal transduction histidine kinase regulating C4-dicarboxylate transport system [Vibrio nigripulchritudo SO65]|uniref:sensor histidine kinase n=1 Tax=Vibrio nigripulchritudo TaxID=28173 RepID=UPI0003B1D253|nr:ATP-binding protein [Vibrio nigripulchritudo]CCN35711.1 putative Signal transduction histidine kinase regulating C4-dicarboxylate transport system [Vibrio nigripulchritudo AM115]CCN43685.1 putative Signal transduction histidine kinase regulating C4-dicarboxylate transport system [Vibrio nigripulchritudo FTn2]CCN65994.1 putative Signal transduction histidine kinase regulating C4-dicarboxylate transport system [Vibrio nigripulchritudo POn4]CCN77987.1 putative Signal transduction histidine kina